MQSRFEKPQIQSDSFLFVWYTASFEIGHIFS